MNIYTTTTITGPHFDAIQTSQLPLPVGGGDPKLPLPLGGGAAPVAGEGHSPPSGTGFQPVSPLKPQASSLTPESHPPADFPGCDQNRYERTMIGAFDRTARRLGLDRGEDEAVSILRVYNRLRASDSVVSLDFIGANEAAIRLVLLRPGDNAGIEARRVISNCAAATFMHAGEIVLAREKENSA